MNIMHVIDSLAVGGAERMLVDIANASVEDGHNVSVVITRSGMALASELDSAIRCVALNRQKRFELSSMRQLTTLIREGEVEVLHVHGRSSFSFMTLLKVTGAVQPPIVLHDHFGGIKIDIRVPVWFRLFGRYACAQYVGVCRDLALWAQSAMISADRINVIHNALDLERFAKGQPHKLLHKPVQQGNLIGIFVGGIREEKGLDVLINALVLCTRLSKLKLLVVGGDRDRVYAELCRSKVNQLGLEHQVEFLGERSDVPDLIHQADFGVIPSRSESGPLTLIEYLAAGVPFVASRVGAIAEEVERRGLPEFVQPGSAEELTDAIDRLLDLSEAEMGRRAKTGIDIAQELFSIEQVMPRWYAVYERALGLHE